VQEVPSWRGRGRGEEGRVVGEGVWCLAETDVSSAKTEVCDYLKKK